MLKFFRLPFATTGDKTAVPDAVDSNGNVSYSQGYGFDYQRQKTDPAAKNIERDKMNQILFDITTAIAEIQAQGVPDYITSALNGGTAYSYGINAVVRYSGELYISLVAANTALPTDATKWIPFSTLLKWGGLRATSFIVLTGNTTLTATHVGATLATSSASAATWTLPAANSVPSGARIEFACYGTGLVTIQRAGTDSIVSWSAAGGTSLAIGNGDILTLESNGGTSWYVVGASIRAKACGVSRSTNLSLAASSYTKVTYDTVEFDAPVFWDTTNQRFVAKFPGKYRISGAGLIASASTAGNIYHEVRKNGVAINCKRGSEMAGQGINTTLVFDAVFDLAVGDYLEVVINNSAAVTQTYGPGSNVNNYCYAQCEYLGQ